MKRFFSHTLLLLLGIALALTSCGEDNEETAENPLEETEQQEVNQEATPTRPRDFLISDDPPIHLENDGDVLDISFSHDNKVLFALSRRKISEYNLGTHQQVGAWDIEDVGSYGVMAISQDGNHLAIGTDLPSVVIWDIPTHSIDRTLETRFDFAADQVDGVTYSSDGQRLVVFVEETVFVWNTAGYQQVARIEAKGNFERMALSPDGHTLALADTSKQLVQFVDMNTFKLNDFIEAPNEPYRILAISFSPDSQFLTIGGYRGRQPAESVFEIWNAKSHHLVIAPDAQEEIGTLAYNTEGTLLAIGGFTDPIVQVWRTDTQQFIATLEIPEEINRGLRFSPDTSLLAAGLEDGEGIFLWKVE